MKLSSIFPVICFAAFVLWLLSIVMDGPLLSAIGIMDATIFFLPVHIASLLLIGFFCPHSLFKRLVAVNCLLATVLTLALPLAGPSLGRYILLPLGASGAFVAVSACITLHQSTAPLLSAASGLVAANLLLMPFNIWPRADLLHFAAVAVPLLAIPVLKRHLPEPNTAPEAVSLWHYLPFIIVFQIISGLMYAFIIPVYHHFARLPGFELLFYILAVIAAFWIVQKNRDLTLVCGVMLGMAAFALLHNGDSPLPVNMGMFAMQAGAGFIDLSIIAILLAFPVPIRAFGFGLATLCTGIIAGKIIGLHFADITESIVIIGHIILNLSILTLYFLGRYHYISQGRGKEIPSAEGARSTVPHGSIPSGQGEDASLADPPIPVSDEEKIANNLPDHLRLLLSEREYLVLKNALAGRTYRETARELEISESTVKTYMYRIYEKMGVKGKKKLFEMLNGFYRPTGSSSTCFSPATRKSPRR